jgi:nucleotide-binding universal stress UspA family protein
MAHVFERLLLATEHTDFDVGAERIALQLAGRCGVPLAAVLPVVSNAEYETIAPELAARADADAAAKRRDLESAAQAAGVTLSVHVRRGLEPSLEIVEEARELGSDLVVARRRGRRGFLANLMLGSMVGEVVAHAPCSVLLVPRAAPMWSQRVLVALDPQAPAALRELLTDTAVALAQECALPLHVTCVVDGGATGQHTAAADVVAQARARARQRGVDADGAVRSGKPYEQIVAAADACGADLVVVGRHGGAVAGRAWLGGTAQKVIGLAERPVLVVVPKGQTA